MNAKELRTAAEYILNEADFIDQADAYAEQLANHILATVKEDDDEPITDDYFHLIPFGKYGILAIVKEGESYFVEIRLRTSWSLILVASHRIREVKTRGELRRLLEALGVLNNDT